MADRNIPNDPMILLSFVNTKLRDEYDSLTALCEDLGLNASEITEKLASIHYSYDDTLNRFL